MSAAYLNQAVNLLVAVMMVPLLLRYLNVSDYVLWSIFTTFGAMTLQFESAIQNVSVREIAKGHHGDSRLALQAALRSAHSAYTGLSLCVLAVVAVIGIVYLNLVADANIGSSRGLEWLIYISAYAVNYYFGKNNSILLGTGHVSKYSNINSFSRLCNLLLTYVMLKGGLSILGLCLSFAVSVFLGCLLMLRAAKLALGDLYSLAEKPNRLFGADLLSGSSSIAKYTSYTLLSFCLYKGALLFVTATFGEDAIASYALALQANTILSAAAIVPMQVWLRRLVNAVMTEKREEALRELITTAAAANGIFIFGSIVMGLSGNALLAVIHSKVLLPSNSQLLLVCAAFLVELNILLLVNFLVTMGNYAFLKTYTRTSVLGIGWIAAMTFMSTDNIAILILAPLVFQSVVCLPAIFRVACVELRTTPALLLSQLGRVVSSRS